MVSVFRCLTLFTLAFTSLSFSQTALASNYTVTELGVEFSPNFSDHVLSGTLTFPKDKQTINRAVVIISGSGPTLRDGAKNGPQSYKVLAEMLSAMGMAVLRFDDRGVGESGGDFASATSADFAEDAIAAVDFLAGFELTVEARIGLIGHSEGGLIAAIAATENARVDYFVSLASPGIMGGDLILEQAEYLDHLNGLATQQLNIRNKARQAFVNAIKKNLPTPLLRLELLKAGATNRFIREHTVLYQSPWMHFFIKANIQQYLQQLEIPILALNGELDSQVKASSNIQGFVDNVQSDLLTVITYPNLNHYFQPAETGHPDEYSRLSVAFSNAVANDIAAWSFRH